MATLSNLTTAELQSIAGIDLVKEMANAVGLLKKVQSPSPDFTSLCDTILSRFNMYQRIYGAAWNTVIADADAILNPP